MNLGWCAISLLNHHKMQNRELKPKKYSVAVREKNKSELSPEVESSIKEGQMYNQHTSVYRDRELLHLEMAFQHLDQQEFHNSSQIQPSSPIPSSPIFSPSKNPGHTQSKRHQCRCPNRVADEVANRYQKVESAIAPTFHNPANIFVPSLHLVKSTEKGCVGFVLEETAHKHQNDPNVARNHEKSDERLSVCQQPMHGEAASSNLHEQCSHISHCSLASSIVLVFHVVHYLCVVVELYEHIDPRWCLDVGDFCCMPRAWSEVGL